MVVVVSAQLEHVTWSLHNDGFAGAFLLKLNRKEINITYLCTCTLFFYKNIFYQNMGCKKYILIKECRCTYQKEDWRHHDVNCDLIHLIELPSHLKLT